MVSLGDLPTLADIGGAAREINKNLNTNHRFKSRPFLSETF